MVIRLSKHLFTRNVERARNLELIFDVRRLVFPDFEHQPYQYVIKDYSNMFC